MSLQVWHIDHTVTVLDEAPTELPASGFLWLAADREDLRSHFAHVQARLAHWTQAPLMDLHVNDLLNDELPSHFDYIQAYDLLVLRRLGAADANDHIDTHAVGFAVYGRVLLSVHPAHCPVLAHFGERLPGLCDPRDPREGLGAHRLPASPDELMLRMLNFMVDGYLDLRRQLTARHHSLQQALLDMRNPFQDWPGLLAARNALRRLEDLCEDQRAAVQEWLDALAEWPAGQQRAERESLRVRARDVMEHIERVLGHAHRLSSATEGAVQMHYAALGHRTNNIMRVLTALTAVFLPLNLITGIFGMNFDALPLIHSALGAWIALGLMAAVALVLGYVFRRKRYLGSKL